MAWVIGIDEAGYGPNLGPFVMTSVACRVPEELVGGNLWKSLRSAVRRFPSEDDGRVLVEDSKLVYSTARGLRDLETAVLATLAPWPAHDERSLAAYIEWACPASHECLRSEAWYSGTSRLPVLAEPPALAQAGDRFRQACQRRGFLWGPVRSVVLCPLRFNELLDHWGSKGAALGHALGQLVQFHLAREDAEPVAFFVDKHGGRNAYAPLLQHAVPEGFVVAHEESLQRSYYSVLGLDRAVRLTFQPRADAEHFCVALASMCSKYLREILMREFNQFWQAHMPGLKPTAGYPGDAARFYGEIRPTAQRLGIPEQALWRRK